MGEDTQQKPKKADEREPLTDPLTLLRAERDKTAARADGFARKLEDLRRELEVLDQTILLYRMAGETIGTLRLLDAQSSLYRSRHKFVSAEIEMTEKYHEQARESVAATERQIAKLEASDLVGEIETFRQLLASSAADEGNDAATEGDRDAPDTDSVADAA